MSKIAGRLTVRKHPEKNLKCLEPNPPENLLWMLLRGNITLSETMRTSTRGGPYYD